VVSVSYVSRHFVIQEYVPRSIYQKMGQTAWELLDDRLLMTDDALRDKFGPIIINNWHLNGDREWSGLRTPESPFYSPTSQHAHGRASDKLFKSVTSKEVRRYILDHPAEFPYIHGLELNVNWVHSDIRNCSGIKTFYA
jgi:hypothetical protein